MPMAIEVGTIDALYRYPVKSMAGERLEDVGVGWHGIDGDRRLAFRRVGEPGGFPWLSAGKLPDLVRFRPLPAPDGHLPTRVRTPEGRELDLFGDQLADLVGRRFGAPVQMMRLDAGMFDEASVSVITEDTVQEIGRESATVIDIRRFRPNIVVRLHQPGPFQEDGWVGGVLRFGDGPSIGVTMRDARCSMLNLDPDSGRSSPEVLKVVVQSHQNNAGVYGTVIRTGRLAVGQTVHFQPLG
jgi:uncharacterized protein